MRKVLYALILIVITALGSSSAQSQEPTTDPAITQTATKILTPTASPTWEATPQGALGPYNFPPDVNPLTGLKVPEPENLLRRPLAVKISNAPPIVRPQAGLNDADLVFEHVTEGKLTRFTAVYWSYTPPRVGSIRSARLIDLEIAEMYGAILAFSGASTGVRDKILSSNFADRAYEGVTVGVPLYYRDDIAQVPHNLFGNPEAMWKRADKDGVNTAPNIGGMMFSDTPQPVGTASTLIKVDYGPTQAEWRYDDKLKLYQRWTDGKQHVDANSLEQVVAANVVLIYAWHQFDYNIVESEYMGNKSFSVEIQIWSLGRRCSAVMGSV